MRPLRFTRQQLLAVYSEVAPRLGEACSRLQVVGDLRRGCGSSAQLEVLAILARKDLLHRFLVDGTISGQLYVRHSSDESKLVTHVESKVPVHLHLTSWVHWWPALVVTTGGSRFVSELIRFASSRGFTLGSAALEGVAGRPLKVRSELGVFRVLGRPYVSPAGRT